jgi:ribonucleoside-triphosphate reductase
MEKCLPTDYQSYIHASRYARWIETDQSRESWEATVRRYIDFFKDRVPTNLPDMIRIEKAILNLEVMPSMRCMMTAGEALARDNVAGYNCSYLPIEGIGMKKEIFIDEIDDNITVNISNPRDWDEAMYILMCGTGVGFSVERQYINQLPRVGKPLSRRLYSRNNKNFPGVDKDELSVIDRKENVIHVSDSKYGWASAFRILVVELYNGNFDVEWDLSQLRPAGAVLKTFGGRSSGPEPLDSLMVFTREMFKKANGRKLTSIECHDLMCKIGDTIVVGGVRRSALISLSNLSDERMRYAKSGKWYEDENQPYRRLANISVAYTEKPDNIAIFMNEWRSLYESGSGERGIFSRPASQRQAAKNGRRDHTYDFGTNPCSEIILRPRQFCNLSEVVARPTDSLGDLGRKVRQATILGTLQSTLTDFKYLNDSWRINTEDEALLGVSITGIMDHPVLSGRVPYFESGTGESPKNLAWVLNYLKEIAIATNKEWAKKLGIKQSAAITCVKPSGTVSQLVDSASGIHPRYAPFYIRRVGSDENDPVGKFLKDSGVPYDINIRNPHEMLFKFPIKSPETAQCRHEVTALQQLELWKTYQDYWCEHKPSITVYVRPDEWLDVQAWVWKHFDEISGISFLPYDDHIYEQAPYEEIDEETYNKLDSEMPKDIDWSKLSEYEQEDMTTATQELACTGGACEL